MLLTPSQVSGLLTSFVTLFLSGYVIQQRTVNQIRASIRQSELRPSPRPHLPDRFRSTTTELEDGTIVVIEAESEADSDAQNPQQQQQQQQQQQKDGIMLEVKPTAPEQQKSDVPPPRERQGRAQQVVMADDKHGEIFAAPPSDVEGDLDRQLGIDDDADDESERDRNLRRLKEKNQLHPDPGADDQKPISRAERRRLIKQEIQRLSYDEEPVYYQRRLY